MIIEWIRDVPLPDNIQEKMQHAADRTVLCEGITVPCAVSVRLCSDETIRTLNAAHRGIDRSTDVLSFPTVSYPEKETAGRLARYLFSDGENSPSFPNTYPANPAIIRTDIITVKRLPLNFPFIFPLYGVLRQIGIDLIGILVKILGNTGYILGLCP